MKGTTAIVGVALIAAVAIVGYNVWKKSQTTLNIGANGITGQIGASATAGAIGAVSNLGTSLGNALAGGIGSLFGGGDSGGVVLSQQDLTPVYG